MNQKTDDLSIRNYDLKNESEKKAYNEKLFNIVAPQYDRITRILSFGRDKAWKKTLMKMLPDINSPVCLDVASGTGDIAALLVTQYPGARVTAFDLNADMLAIARKRLENITAITYETGDMTDIRKPAGSFDLITGGYALRNAPDLKKTFLSLHRIVKSGGVCAFLDFSRSANPVLSRIQIFFLKFWGSLWGLLFHGKPEVYGYIADSLALYPDSRSLNQLIEECGFKVTGSRFLFFGFTRIIVFKKS